MIPEKIETPLTKMLDIRYPIIMAPMFLVSNEEMVLEAAKAGITGAIPALNWRTEAELRKGLELLKDQCQGPWGINLIVNKSNIKLDFQLKALQDFPPDYIITSLGSPRKVIEIFKPLGVKVFCDVINREYAQKVVDLGADALIAVNAEAGGHCGPVPASKLIPDLVAAFDIPVISAGGVGDAKGLKEKLDLGAVGASVGSPFIATNESPVSQDYKQACVDYGADDIVLTKKISGTPCTVINTPYVKEIGTEQNWLESLLAKNKSLKKWVKMLTYAKGMKSVEKAAFQATYKTVWCAGPTIEYTKNIRPVRDVVTELLDGYDQVA